MQTAVESENHLIVHYEVTSECTDWHLLGDGINVSKAALGVENLEGVADRGYSNDEEILQCLSNRDTPTTSFVHISRCAAGDPVAGRCGAGSHETAGTGKQPVSG